MKSETLSNDSQRDVFDQTREQNLSNTASLKCINPCDLEALIHKVIKRDQTAFITLYDRVSTPLYSLALTMLGKEEHACEVLQESFAWIWANARNFRKHEGSAFSWLVTLVRKRALVRLRNEGPSNALIEYCTTVLKGQRTSPEVPQTTCNLKIRQGFRSLSEDEQQVLKLAFFAGLNQQEIAERLDVSPETIRKLAFEGILRLHSAIENSP